MFNNLVGQDLWEEINIIESGVNYGWAIMEANRCDESPWPCAPGCDPTGLIHPVWAYDHDQGIAVTGGCVYRGLAVPALTGERIYTDWLSGTACSLEYDGINSPVNTELLTAVVTSSTFGGDGQNKLYFSCTVPDPV